MKKIISQKEYLELDMELHFKAYLKQTEQVIMAEAKMQEDKPSFTTLQSATVPIKPTGPNRMFNVLLFVGLTSFIVTILVFYREKDLKYFVGLE